MMRLNDILKSVFLGLAADPFGARNRLSNASPPRPMGVAARVIPKEPSLVRSPSGAAFQGGYKFASLPTHGASHGGEAAERKARRFSAKQARRNSAALFLPAPSVLNRPCFGFELRARADSPRFRGSLPAFAGEATCGRSCGGAGRDDAEAERP